MQDNAMGTKTKKKAIYLSNAQRIEIAKFCIEHRCVVADGNKKFTKWRVARTTAVDEMYLHLGIDCTPHHLEQSVKFYDEICDLLQSHPNVPAIQDTVEMDILTAENKRLKGDIKEITEEFTKLKTTYNAILKKYSELIQAMRNISRFIPADCFGIRDKPEPKIGRSL